MSIMDSPAGRELLTLAIEDAIARGVDPESIKRTTVTRRDEPRSRKMPSARAIHSWWANNRFHEWAVWFKQVDLGEPSCYRCGRWGDMGTQERNDVDEFAGLERAHVVDRCRGGLDVEPNLILLCSRCHRSMPEVSELDADVAFRWVVGGESWLIDAARVTLADLPPAPR